MCQGQETAVELLKMIRSHYIRGLRYNNYWGKYLNIRLAEFSGKRQHFLAALKWPLHIMQERKRIQYLLGDLDCQ